MSFFCKTVDYKNVFLTKLIIRLQVERIEIFMIILNRYLGNKISVLGIKEPKVPGGFLKLCRIAENLYIIVKLKLLVDIAGEL